MSAPLIGRHGHANVISECQQYAVSASSLEYDERLFSGNYLVMACEYLNFEVSGQF